MTELFFWNLFLTNLFFSLSPTKTPVNQHGRTLWTFSKELQQSRYYWQMDRGFSCLLVLNSLNLIFHGNHIIRGVLARNLVIPQWQIMAKVTFIFQHCLYPLALGSAFRQCSLAQKREGQNCSGQFDPGRGSLPAGTTRERQRHMGCWQP